MTFALMADYPKRASLRAARNDVAPSLSTEDATRQETGATRRSRPVPAPPVAAIEAPIVAPAPSGRRAVREAASGRRVVTSARRPAAPLFRDANSTDVELHLGGAPERSSRVPAPRAAVRRLNRSALFAASALGVTGLLVALNFVVPDGRIDDTAMTISYQPKRALLAQNDLSNDVGPTLAPARVPSDSATATTRKKRRAASSTSTSAASRTSTEAAAVPTSSQPTESPTGTAPAATTTTSAAESTTTTSAAESTTTTTSAAETQTSSTEATRSAQPTQTTQTTEPTQAAQPPRVVLNGSMGGWYAGAGGDFVANGDFQRWLGQNVSIVGTWADTDSNTQRQMGGLSDYTGWQGAIDIAVGGTTTWGEDYWAAANGAYDDRWRAQAEKLKQVRGNVQAPTFVRPWHEANGSWYGSWNITPGNVEAYKQSFRRMAGIFRSVMPQVYIVWSPNYSSHSAVGVDGYYPGNDVVDVIGPDFYSDWDVAQGAQYDYAKWSSVNSGWNRGSPIGIEAWRVYAESKGKPLAMPEWGLKPDPTDFPTWFDNVNKWAQAHQNYATWKVGEAIPGGASGKLLYSVYFNKNHDSINNTVYGFGANPNASARFRELRWGNN